MAVAIISAARPGTEGFRGRYWEVRAPPRGPEACYCNGNREFPVVRISNPDESRIFTTRQSGYRSMAMRRLRRTPIQNSRTIRRSANGSRSTASADRTRHLRKV